MRHQPPNPLHIPDRSGEQTEESDICADAYPTVQNHHGGHIHGKQNLAAGKDFYRWPEHCMKVGNFHAAAVLLPILLFKALNLIGLARKCFHHAYTGQPLLQAIGKRRVLTLVGLENNLHPLEKEKGSHGSHGQHRN